MSSLADFIKDKLPYCPNWLNLVLLKLNCLGRFAYGLSYAKKIKEKDEYDCHERLLRLVNYAIKHVPYYRNKYNGLVISNIQEFEDNIDFIDKNIVLENWESFVSDLTDKSDCIVATTGGTSGKPMKMLMPKNRYVNELINLHRHYIMYGWNYDLCAVFRNHHLKDGRKYIVNPLMRQIIFDPFKLAPEYVKYIWGVMHRYNVFYVHAYPSNAYQFFKMCIEQNLDLSFIKACFLSSEPVLPYQRHLFEDVLKIQYFSFYGHTEKLIFAGNRPGEYELFHVNKNYGYLELVNNDDVVKAIGVSGEMVGTTFYNYDFPLIRYRTNDFSHYELLDDKVQVLGSIEGRWHNTLIFKLDGSYVPLATINIHGVFNEHIEGIQYIQREYGKIEVLIIKNDKYTDKDELFIKEHISEIFDGNSDCVTVKYVNNLITQKNGKFLPLISYLND